jgi:quinol monooxygenase YgiN
MTTSSSRAVVVGYMQISPNDRAALVKVLLAHVPRVLRKDGCISYSFAADVLDPNVIRMSELWRDQEALEAHLQSDEFQSVLREMEKIKIVRRSVQRHTVSETAEI